MNTGKIFNKSVYFFILFVFMSFSSLININCITCRNIINPENTNKLADKKIYWVILKNGKTIVFDRMGGKYINRNKKNTIHSDSLEYITGTNAVYQYMEIPAKEVLEAQIDDKCFDFKIPLLLLNIPSTFIILMIIAYAVGGGH
jgi:hypothetical protein